MEYRPARSKAEAVDIMYRLAEVASPGLGPGSTERKSALEALSVYLGLAAEPQLTKHGLAKAICEEIGAVWDDTCWSGGNTITLAGLNRLLQGTGHYVASRGSQPQSRRWHEVTSESSPPLDSIQVDDTTRSESMEGLSEIQQAVAQHLAILSEKSPTPRGFGDAMPEISVGDVRFDDGSWRDGVRHVEGWLRLPFELDASSPAAFDARLARALSLEDSDRPWMDDRREEVLLPRLLERLQTAVELRDDFLARLDEAPEGAATLESASVRWEQRWDSTEEEVESEGSGPILAEAYTWAMSELINFAEDGELNLSPSYQRADVWPTRSAQMLMESILRGIPLPSIILLQKSMGETLGYEVVDGKQRLTAILRFRGAHPKAISLVEQKSETWGIPNLKDIFQSDYPTFKKLWKENERKTLTATEEKELYLPFALRKGDVPPLAGDLESLKGKYYSQFREETIPVATETRKVRTLFESGTSKYKIPVIVFNQVTDTQVHEVFSLYNKQGKHLNAEEIRNALYHRLDLMRALIVTSGDSEDPSIAPFLEESWAQLASTPDALNSYGFTGVGYKRSKVLSWVAATLLLETAKPITQSTAAHINGLLRRIQEDSNDTMRSPDRVRALMELIGAGIDAQVASPGEAWPAAFRNAQQSSSATGSRPSRWQELQLVSTLVALTAAAAVLGGEVLLERIEERAEEIAERTLTKGFQRPSKTQSREQWMFMGTVVVGLLEVLGIDLKKADNAIRERFGTSGLASLALTAASAPS